MKFLNLNKVLCLSAHPDDVEYSMLGSIIRFEDTIFDIAVLSTGGDFDTTNKNRGSECSKIWINFDNISGSVLSNGHVKDKSEDEWINIIENKYDISEYDCVFAPPCLDSHFEHRITNNIAYALLRSTNSGLVTYKTPSTLESWKPNYYVDVNHLINKKDSLLKNFESQVGRSYFKLNSIRAFHSNYISSKFGVDYVEHFKIERLFS